MRRQVSVIVLVLLGTAPIATAVVLQPAAYYIERGYTLLAQARLAGVEGQREQLLEEAAEAFKKGYQQVGRVTRVQALIGVAQSYLWVQKPRRVFPFLWQATPLQRAEKTLQQALVLQPDNAAAALLLGVVYWRQSGAAAAPDALRERSQTFLMQAAALGVPVHMSAPAAAQTPAPIRPFGVADTLLMVRYVDARGTGEPNDMVVAYRTADAPDVCFGVVVTAGMAYPLIADPETQAMLPTANLETLTITPQPDGPPLLRVRAQALETRFIWDGSRFVYRPSAS